MLICILFCEPDQYQHTTGLLQTRDKEAVHPLTQLNTSYCTNPHNKTIKSNIKIHSSILASYPVYVNMYPKKQKGSDLRIFSWCTVCILMTPPRNYIVDIVVNVIHLISVSSSDGQLFVFIKTNNPLDAFDEIIIRNVNPVRLVLMASV